MRRSVTTPLISLAVLVAVLVGWRIFAHGEAARYAATRRVAQLPSAIRLQFVVHHLRGPIQTESWRMQDIDGASKASYAATDRNGTTARFTQKLTGFDVSFLFERLVQDGIWELPSKPPRGNTDDTYDVSVAQTVGGRSGSHQFTVTDPRYWATTGGRQYRIRLDPKKPVPNIVDLKSTSIAEPRYAKVVADFEGFGSPGFRSTVAKAKERAQRS